MKTFITCIVVIAIGYYCKKKGLEDNWRDNFITILICAIGAIIVLTICTLFGLN